MFKDLKQESSELTGKTGAEFPKSPELEVDPRSIAIATTTSYPKWYPGETQEHDVVDKIRGDLAIQTIKEAKQKKYQVLVVDGGSSEAFKTELAGIETPFLPELERGMSPSRQQAFTETAKLEGVKVICWIEPEKVSVIRDCLPEAVLPILNDEADIVVPKRTDLSFKTYPDYQVKYEQRGNRLWNNILRARGLLAKDSEDLDVWFGPKFFRNNPELVKLFLNKYEFIKGKTDLHKIVKPELHPNAIFLPVVAALHKDFRVKSVDVPYIHPSQQTAIEVDDPKFIRTRDTQRKNIIVSTMHLIRLLEADPQKKSRLVPK